MAYDIEQLRKQYNVTSAEPSEDTGNYDIDALRKKYNVGAEPVPGKKEPTFGGKVIRGVIKPFARVLATAEGKDLKSGYLGDVKQVGVAGQNDINEKKRRGEKVTTKDQLKAAGKDLLDIFGTGAELASNFVGGEGAADVGINATKGLAKKAVVSGLKGGAKTGFLGGLGSSLQDENKTIGSVVKNTALSTGLGTITGGALGGIGGKIGSDLSRPNAINELEKTYQELAESTKPTTKRLFKGQKVTELKNLAGTEGRTPERVLAEDGIIPKQKGTRLYTLKQAEEYRASNSHLRDANREALKEVEQSVPKVNLNDARQSAIQSVKTPENINGGKFKGLEKEINQEYDDLIEHYGNEVPLTTLDDIKTDRWKGVNFDSTRPLLKDANYAIAKSHQKIIEDVADKAGFKDVAQLNREMGDRLEAAKFLESLDSKTLKFGKLGRYAFQNIGSAMGHTILGKMVGALGGDAFANFLIKNSVAGPVKRLVLKNLSRTNPEAFNAAMKFIEHAGLSRDIRLGLPEPKSIQLGPESSKGILDPLLNKLQIIQGKNAVPERKLLPPPSSIQLPEVSETRRNNILFPKKP